MWIMWKENKFNKVLVRKHDMPKVLWFAKVKPPDNLSKQPSGLEQILARDLTSYLFEHTAADAVSFTSLNDLMEIANNTITNEESYWPKHAIQDSTISQFNDSCQTSKTNW